MDSDSDIQRLGVVSKLDERTDASERDEVLGGLEKQERVAGNPDMHGNSLGIPGKPVAAKE